MKNWKTLTLIIGASLILTAFTQPINSDTIFGVSGENPNHIVLTLKSDHTFTYTDYSNPSKRIDTQGDWIEKKGKIVLFNYESEFEFHDQWKIVKNGSFAKSRKGMLFYTLCRL